MNPNVTVKRELDPMTDSIHFTLTYSLSVGAYLTVEEAIRGGDAAVAALLSRLENELMYDIAKDVE